MVFYLRRFRPWNEELSIHKFWFITFGINLDKKKILLSILAIWLVLLLISFLSNLTTTIYDIENNPDKYIDRKVTITGRPGGSFSFLTVKNNLGELKGFRISDNKTYGRSYLPAEIFVDYASDIPSRVIKDKWGRDKATKIKVKGIVRHKVMKIGSENKGIFYIEGESWEYVD